MFINMNVYICTMYQSIYIFRKLVTDIKFVHTKNVFDQFSYIIDLIDKDN